MCGRGHAWQEACMVGWACVEGQVCMAGRHAWWGHAWQEWACVHGSRDGHCSEQYASYWNAFFFLNITQFSLPRSKFGNGNFMHKAKQTNLVKIFLKKKSLNYLFRFSTKC